MLRAQSRVLASRKWLPTLQLSYAGCNRLLSTAGASKFSKTVNLPNTTFPVRSNPLETEVKLQPLVSDELYQWNVKREIGESAGQPTQDFVLHDGPPYANGKLHIGHFLNKVLKDMINRYKLMQGYRVTFIPGWDCHGLPIELKALDAIKGSQKSQLSAVQIREIARKFALEAVEGQKKDFQRWGVMGDWGNAYLTMDPSYEAEQLGLFWDLVQKGLIYRGLKPVHWSPSSKTALAEAELEYNDAHTSTAIYAGMTVCQWPGHETLLSKYPGLKLVIWTTTPWTLPANQAISYSPIGDYVITKDQQGRHLLLMSSRVGDLSRAMGSESDFPILARVPAESLAQAKYHHPWVPHKECPLLGGDHVKDDSGSGLVHTAPGHGLEDFEICQRYSIPVVCPVDESGKYTPNSEAGELLTGKHVLKEGTGIVVEQLTQKGTVLTSYKYSHKYPYDWRTKQPVIFRATQQWFCRVEGLQEQALKALESVRMIPSSGRARLESFVAGRKEWCISRQRHWGLPIPVFYDSQTGEAIMSESLVNHVQKLFREKGADVWWTASDDELFPQELRPDASRSYTRGTDTLDVWFDSGVSWRSALSPRGVRQLPVDLYLEGSDQHRGWFQSSLLLSVANTGKAPFKTILTHGFVLDENGRKMSKSEGNVVDPSEVIAGGVKQGGKPSGKGKSPASQQGKSSAYGADVLRLWASSVDYAKDVCLGSTILARTEEALKKVRGTFRYMLGCLSDFDPSKHTVPYEQLCTVDRYLLHLLQEFQQQVTTQYEQYEFFKVYNSLVQFVNVTASTFYFDISKDRLYSDAVDSHARRSCQTVMLLLYSALLKASAPILVHTTQEAFSHTPEPLKLAFGASQTQAVDSVFTRGWLFNPPTGLKYPADWSSDPDVVHQWNLARRVKSHVNAALEKCRNAGHIGSASEAQVILQLPKESPIRSDLEALGVELNWLFLTSSTTVTDVQEQTEGAQGILHSAEGELEGTPLRIFIRAADGVKCSRCWKFSPECLADIPECAGDSSAKLCPRCVEVLRTRN